MRLYRVRPSTAPGTVSTDFFGGGVGSNCVDLRTANALMPTTFELLEPLEPTTLVKHDAGLLLDRRLGQPEGAQVLRDGQRVRGAPQQRKLFELQCVPVLRGARAPVAAVDERAAAIPARRAAALEIPGPRSAGPPAQGTLAPGARGDGRRLLRTDHCSSRAASAHALAPGRGGGRVQADGLVPALCGAVREALDADGAAWPARAGSFGTRRWTANGS